MTEMEIRGLTVNDEAEAVAAHRELAVEGFDFLMFYREGENWVDYLDWLAAEADGEHLMEGRVAGTFLVAVVDGRIAGRVSVRHELNDALRAHGGHVGYAVRPEFRRRGLATALLRAGLTLLAGLGIEEALVTCEESNAGSAAVIERCGGVLERTADFHGSLLRHYRCSTA